MNNANKQSCLAAMWENCGDDWMGARGSREGGTKVVKASTETTAEARRRRIGMKDGTPGERTRRDEGRGTSASAPPILSDAGGDRY